MIAVREEIESNRIEPEGKGVLLPLFGAAGFGTPRFLLANISVRSTTLMEAVVYVFRLCLRIFWELVS